MRQNFVTSISFSFVEKYIIFDILVKTNFISGGWLIVHSISVTFFFRGEF